MAGKRMKITDLRIYPIKSCRGISLQNTTLTRQGLKHDRRWMFIDANNGNKFITIREKSEMTLIKTSINNTTQSLDITFPAHREADLSEQTISVPLYPTDEYLQNECQKIDVEIWKHETDAYEYTSPTITTPITQFFESINPDSNSIIKLVMKGPQPRPAGGNGSAEHLGRTEFVAFPDVLPVLVASQTSLDELNTRLKQRSESPITIERFRPNIIVDSPDLVAWEEDEWRLLRLNPPSSSSSTLLNTLTPSFLSTSIDLDVSARCARCQVPNVDPDTAEKHKKEPWSLLYSYRRVDEGMKVKPCFGMLCCPRSTGNVEVGMDCVVQEVMEAAGGLKGTKHHYVKGF